MSTPRRLLLTGALIAIPVAFALGSVVLAQMPAAPQLPAERVSVQLAPPVPTDEPVPSPPSVPAPSAPAPPAPAPAPAPVPNDDDNDDDGGDDD